MNAIFFIIFTLSVIFISFSSPDLVLKSITDGANKGILLSFNLLAIYSVWSGILEIAQNCGLNAKISKLLKPIMKILFASAVMCIVIILLRSYLITALPSFGLSGFLFNIISLAILVLAGAITYFALMSVMRKKK